MKTKLENFDLEKFSRDGFAGPFSFLDEREVSAVMNEYRLTTAAIPQLIPSPGEASYWEGIGKSFPWFKSLHVVSPLVRKLSRNPLIVSLARELLGANVMLWGAEIIEKGPGKSHRWHVDAEAWSWPSLNVWVGLENVCKDCSLKIIPGSHRYTPTLQELAKQAGMDLMNDNHVVSLAKSFDPKSEIVRFDIKPGQFYVFEGRTWHGSDNLTQKTRSSLLLQYSNTRASARIPKSFNPPFGWLNVSPPCLLVAGSKARSPNTFMSNEDQRL